MTAAPEISPPAGSKRRWLRLADRRIRTKLTLLVGLPVVLVLLLAGYTASTSLSATAQTGTARQLVDVGTAGAGLTGQLQQERAAAALLLTRHSPAKAADAYRQQNTATDHALAVYSAAQDGLDYSNGLAAPLRRLNDQLAALPLLRQDVRSGNDATESSVVFRYSALISALLGFGQSLSQADIDADTADQLRAVSTLSQGIEALGTLQVSVVPAIAADTLTPAAQQQVIAADAAFASSQESFRQLAPASWQVLITSQPGSKQILTGERLHSTVVRTDANTGLELGVSPAGWVAAMTARMRQLHQVEGQFLAEDLAAVTVQRDQQRRNTVVLGLIVLVSLLGVGAIGWWVTRSMTAPLARLAAEATEVAQRVLPRMESQLNKRGVTRQELDEALEAASRPLPVPGNDEIGQVIAAFNDARGSAARVAAGQAEFREIVAAAFKTQAYEQGTRIDAITSTLDRREREDFDNPQRLDHWYELDQLVTTLLRSVGTMQLFSGGRVGQPRSEPLRLPDVVTAAVSRVEEYQRVEQHRIPLEVMIDGDLVDELIHLLVELLTNAIRMSQGPVEVTAKPTREWLYMEIRDHGLGLNEQQQREMQQRIDHFILDEFTARHYGLAAVGLIAARRGIKVELDSLAKDGTSVNIAVPAGSFWHQPFLLAPMDERPAPTQMLPARPVTPAPPAMPAPAAIDARPLDTRALTAVAGQPSAADALDATVVLPALTGVRAGMPQGPQAGRPLPIYETVAASHLLFDPHASVEHVVQSVTVDWVRAEPDQPHPQQELLTASGLPVRVPGRLTPAEPVPVAPPAVPRPRDARAGRAQWSSFGKSGAAFVRSR
ncbi:nitrate- and nitrite sensing domain-containing protein [Nucisporomicrobium flavum]|uniref:nitrate- and nitrite sensing domain-containing protein n=1 Tax=Nucisporomicrobium flavum TaxID=2785915 RepID=UPI0018F29902|nr:nitrate- and nitrite sensing domain-containing protein [Nucisporomicrobium flavum]